MIAPPAPPAGLAPALPLQLKAVYWGPGESGKTTNFRVLKRAYHAQLASGGFSVETTEGRTLWADSLHLVYRLPLAGATRLVVVQLTTCTGQERFLATREHVLANADGVVFVADATPGRLAENLRSFRELRQFTRGRGTPIVVQLNKVDVEPRLARETFAARAGVPAGRVHEASATLGTGVVECFVELVERMLVAQLLPGRPGGGAPEHDSGPNHGTDRGG